MRLISLFALALLSCGSLFASDSSVVEVRSRYKSCDPFNCFIATNQGSGVVIGERDGRPVIATCLHNLGNRQSCRVTVTINTQPVEASVIGYSTALDAALLQLDTPAEIEAVEIDDAPAIAADVDMIGFPDGRFTRATSKFVRRDQSGNLVANRPTRLGQSGGGLFARGRLVGIVKWTDDRRGESSATSAAELVGMAKHYKIKLKAKARSVIAAAPPVPPPPPEAPPFIPPQAGNDDLNRKLDALTQRLASLEAVISKIPAGAVGPMGPSGPVGSPGSVGPNGPAGIVTVILIGPDGKELKRAEQVESGSVVRLNVTKLLKKD